MKELGSSQSLDFSYNIGSPLVSSLTAHPEDFGLASLHNYMSQFPEINVKIIGREVSR